MPFQYRTYEASVGLENSDDVGFTFDQRSAILLQVSISVSVEPKTPYRSFRYPRFKSFYGYAQVMVGPFVKKVVPLEFLNQLIFSHRNLVTENRLTGITLEEHLAQGIPFTLVGAIITLDAMEETSIRIRLQPGTQANMALKWTRLEPVASEITMPDDASKAGSPTRDNNSVKPGQRPSSQGRDPLDTSENDGGDENSGIPKPTGTRPFDGKWVVQFDQNGCDGRPYNTHVFEVPGYDDDNPVLAASSSTNPPSTANVGCNGEAVPKAFLVSSKDNRNMMPSGSNLNAFVGNARITATFVGN